MKAWQIVSKKSMNIVKMPIEYPEADQVKVKVSKASITSTDIAIYLDKAKAKFPIIPSRIAVGLISEAPEESGYKKGQRVLLSPYILDKSQAQKNLPIDSMGLDKNGYLSDFVTISQSLVYVLPDDVTDEEALFVEYIAMGIKTLETLNIDKQEYVVIFGANAISNIMAQLAIYYKAIPIIVDNDKNKLKVAENSGIYYIINSDEENVTNKIKEITGGKFADCTIFACRATQSPPLAFENTAYGGRVGIIGYNKFVNKLNADLRPILFKKLKVIGIDNGVGAIDSALNVLANRAIEVTHLIDKTVDFEHANILFEESAKDPDRYLKVVVDC